MESAGLLPAGLALQEGKKRIFLVSGCIQELVGAGTACESLSMSVEWAGQERGPAPEAHLALSP